MSTTFSFPRLLQLIKKQWFENSRMYFFATLALLALQALVFTFWIFSDGPSYSEDFVYVMFLVGLFLSGTVFASVAFSMFTDKSKASYWLSFPASHLEKLLCVIFYTTIVFSLIYCATFYLVKTAAVAYVYNRIEDQPEIFSYSIIRNTKEFWSMFTIFIYGFIAVQALYLMGSVYFARYSFIVTTIIGTAILFVFLLYMSEISQTILPMQYHWAGSSVDFHGSDGQLAVWRRYSLPSYFTDPLIWTVKLMWAPVFWLVTWFRLKEKQV